MVYWNQGYPMQAQMRPGQQMPGQQFPGQQMLPPQQFPVQQFPGQQFPGQQTSGIPTGRPAGALREQSYIENILRDNPENIATFYFSFERATIPGGTNTKRIRGYAEQAGRDHVVIREESTGNHFLMPMIYFDFAEFDEEFNYTLTPPQL